MPEFWLDSGYRPLDRTMEGELEVTDDFLRAYFMRPEIEPVGESCDVERTLHESLMIEPRRDVSPEKIEALADPDAQDNYRVLIEFRNKLIEAGTLEKCYITIFQSPNTQTPPLFINQLVQIILRNILDGSSDALKVKIAEIFFREQKISLNDGNVLAADAETINILSENSGFGALGQLIVEAGATPRTMEMDVLDRENSDIYWERPSQFDTAVSLNNNGEAIDALCRVMEGWVFHFYKANVNIQPMSEINDDKWKWHIGLDAVSTQILNELYNGEVLDEITQRKLLGLFKMEFEDQELIKPDIAGRPIYLGMAVNEDNILRFKPQNLLTNLPFSDSV